MQAAACPGGVERGPLRGTGDFPGKARRISAKGSKPFGAKHKPRFLGNDAWRGDSRSLSGESSTNRSSPSDRLGPGEVGNGARLIWCALVMIRLWAASR